MEGECDACTYASDPSKASADSYASGQAKLRARKNANDRVLRRSEPEAQSVRSQFLANLSLALTLNCVGYNRTR
jgi:hypothetical protein